MNASQAVSRAFDAGRVIPAFNVPYLPMIEPVARAIGGEGIVAMIQVARLEWEKFEAGSLERVAEEYARHRAPGTLLHLDHVPIIDEDGLRVDYLPILRRAISAGYQSLMVDGSRLPLNENIAATAEAAQLAREAGLPCEAELGAVMGHESGPSLPYDEIFQRRLGFTDVAQATRFARESGCSWLSVAVASVHGAIAQNMRDQKKPAARLDIGHIGALREALGIPMVLHGGSGIEQRHILGGIAAGIAKINIG
ncbi:MAG: class II fructose-bisphosphate aldolase, partial [Clostridiales bacterium]|nr:class II fructose-bisphosphate aldolase [Clostridiales bacterium]